MDRHRILKKNIKECFDSALKAVDPQHSLMESFCRFPIPELAQAGKYYIISFGKAACAMAETTLAVLPETAMIGKAIIVTNSENARPVKGADLYEAGHPLPDQKGAVAAQIVIDTLRQCQQNDLVICLISGGGSALLPAPVPEISFEDKMQTNHVMLQADMPISDINLVRQHLSQLKGGGLRQIAAPARTISYILSDVIGNDLNVIASGPTMQKIAFKSQARNLLADRSLLVHLPEKVQAYLDLPDQYSLGQLALEEESEISKNYHLIASNINCLNAIHMKLKNKFHAVIVTDKLCGNVSEAAQFCFQRCHEISSKKGGEQKPVALIFGGETTVNVTGKGLGGRNQELALRFAALAEHDKIQKDWSFMSAGTDGRDGPTEAAGAIVNSGTLARIKAAGYDIQHILAENDSYTALKASGDLLITGGTGTNVADIQLFLAY